MSDFIVLSGVGPDKPGIARAISGAAYRAGCSIEDSRMAVLGGEFAILVLLEGDSERIKEFSGSLGELERETGLSLSVRPTTDRAQYTVRQGVPYRMTVVGMDRTGIVFRVTEVLARYGVNIDNLETEAHNAPVTGTPMFRMTLDADVPGEVQMGRLREQLSALCDELNMDFSLDAQG